MNRSQEAGKSCENSLEWVLAGDKAARRNTKRDRDGKTNRVMVISRPQLMGQDSFGAALDPGGASHS